MLNKNTFLGLSFLIAIVTSGQAYAASIDASVQDAKTGKSVENAVVVAIPVDGTTIDPAVMAGVDKNVLIDQIDKEFVNYVTPVYKGAEVLFPNKDVIRHHVYSFSEAKSFDIPLFKGTPADAILFDKPGDVSLGCNIHDWMKGFVYVSDSPYFAQSDASGRATIKDLPAGNYSIQVWHPNLRGKAERTAQQITVASNTENQALTFEIKQKKVWKAFRAPAAAEGSYN